MNLDDLRLTKSVSSSYTPLPNIVTGTNFAIGELGFFGRFRRDPMGSSAKVQGSFD